MFKVGHHPEAETELINAATFYNHKVPGLGADFLAEINRAVNVIRREPTRWRKVEGSIHRYIVKRFLTPFFIESNWTE